MPEIVTRFAPSPTGPCHLGSARTALFVYLFAKKMDGKFLLRLEDTDRERSDEKWTAELIESLKWLGIEADETVRQSERGHFYDAAVKKLLESGAAYECFCTPGDLAAEREAQMARKEPPRYAGRCRSLTPEQKAAFRAEGRAPAVRFRVPESGVLESVDAVLGPQKLDLKNLADFLIRKPNGDALFILTNLVDDLESGVTHAIRGADHLANSPKQILLARALGAEAPIYATIPLLLNPDRSKMSKRDAEQLRIFSLRDRGFLPAAVVNFAALLGWNPGDEREIFSMEELIKNFTLERVQKSPAIVDADRLKFFQERHFWGLSPEKKLEKIRPFLAVAGIKNSPAWTDKDFDQYFAAAVAAVGERLVLPAEAPDLLNFFFVRPAVDPALFPHAKMKVDAAGARDALEKLENWLPETGTDREKILEKIAAAGLKNGQILWPLRVALTGEPFSPGAFEVAEVLGADETIIRIRAARTALGG